MEISSRVISPGGHGAPSSAVRDTLTKVRCAVHASNSRLRDDAGIPRRRINFLGRKKKRIHETPRVVIAR